MQYRNYDFIGDLNQLLLRTGIGYNLSENNNNVLLGYAYVHSHNYDADQNISQLDEHRLFQQFITKQKFGRVQLNHRYRIEERFLQPKTEVRFRYQLGIIVPFNNTSLVKIHGMPVYMTKSLSMPRKKLLTETDFMLL